MMIETVILDFDDTLCLTEEACFHLENKIADSMGHEPMSREVHKANWGTDLKGAIVERIPGIDPDVFMEEHRKFLRREIAEGDFDQISDENFAALDQLLSLGYKIAVLTSRKRSEVEHLLEEDHPLNQRISAFHYFESSDYTKPDPRVFDDILAKLEVSATQVVYVGDSPSDAKASNGAGIRFIASLESQLREKKDFDGLVVEAFIYSFQDLEQVLKDLER